LQEGFDFHSLLGFFFFFNLRLFFSPPRVGIFWVPRGSFFILTPLFSLLFRSSGIRFSIRAIHPVHSPPVINDSVTRPLLWLSERVREFSHCSFLSPLYAPCVPLSGTSSTPEALDGDVEYTLALHLAVDYYRVIPSITLVYRVFHLLFSFARVNFWWPLSLSPPANSFDLHPCHCLIFFFFFPDLFDFSPDGDFEVTPSFSRPPHVYTTGFPRPFFLGQPHDAEPFSLCLLTVHINRFLLPHKSCLVFIWAALSFFRCYLLCPDTRRPPLVVPSPGRGNRYVVTTP